MSRIVRNTTAVAAAFASNTTLSFIQIKLLTRWLPQAELGEYFATVALGAIISVLAQIGLPMVVLRFTAKYDALDDIGRIRRLVGFGWSLVLGLSVVLILAESRFLPGLLPRIYQEPPAVPNVLLATAVFVAMALRQVTYACFDGLRRMVYPALFENLNIGIITLCIVVMRTSLTLSFLLKLSLASGGGMLAVASAVLLWVLARERREREARGAARGVEAASRAPAGREIGSRASPPLLPDILPFWSGAALNGLVGICYGHADKLLISFFLPFQMVSIFYVAERLSFLMKRLLAVTIQVASPEMTRRWELHRRETLRHDLGFLVKVQLAIAILVGAIAYALAESAVVFVSSDAYLDAVRLLRLLVVSVVLMAAYAPITTFMRAIDRIHLALLSDVLWIGLYLGLGALLVPGLGLIGIAVAQITASAVTAGYNFVVGERVGRIAWDIPGVLRVVGLGIVLAAAGTAVAQRFPPSSWLLAAATALGVALLFNVLLVGSGALSHRDRRRFLDLAGDSRAARLIDDLIFWPMGRGRRPESIDPE